MDDYGYIPLYKGYEPFRKLVSSGEIKFGKSIRVYLPDNSSHMGHYVYIPKGLRQQHDGEVYDPKVVLSEENAPKGWEVGTWAIQWMTDDDAREAGSL